MAGRTPKLTPKVQAAILKSIAAGTPHAHAANMAGISAKTLRRYVLKGEAGKTPYVSFVADLKKAESKQVESCVKRILAASRKTWQAAAWFLERTQPQHFASNQIELNKLRRENAELKKMVPPDDKVNPDSKLGLIARLNALLLAEQAEEIVGGGGAAGAVPDGAPVEPESGTADQGVPE